MKWILLFSVLLSCHSCGSPFKKLMYAGKVVQTNYHETIPFDFSKGLPMIKVSIQGNEYNFLLDTGAPNVISKELSEQIEYKVITSMQIGDSQGVKRKQQTVSIEQIKIGGIVFENTGAIIIDYKQVYEMACFDFDGIIGSNLMAKAFWELDYEMSNVSFSDELSAFEIPTDAYVISFIPKNGQQTPLVKVKVNEETFKWVTFDTGATGAMGLKVEEGISFIDSLEVVELRGSTSSGVYGDGGISTTKYAKVDSVMIGDIKLLDQVVEFEDQGSMTLGNKFLKNYRVIIDWDSLKIHLIKTSGYDNREYRNFGWLPKIKDQKLIVNGLVTGSFAESIGMELGTQVTKFNHVDYRKITYDAGCQFITEKPTDGIDTMNITILKNGVETDLVLPKETFISEVKN